MSTLNPIQMRYPFEAQLADQPQGIRDAHRYAFYGLVDMQKAVSSLKGQITSLQKASASSSTSSSNTASIVTESGFPGLGTVNDQTGNTAYVVQDGDNGILLVLSDSATTDVTLNNAVTTPWLMFFANTGSGEVVFTPLSGTITSSQGAGASSLTVPSGQWGLIVFDGTNWWAAASTEGVQELNGLTGDIFIVPGFGIGVTVTAPDIAIETTTHSESLTDGLGNFIFAGGDIVTVYGVPNP